MNVVSAQAYGGFLLRVRVLLIRLQLANRKIITHLCLSLKTATQPEDANVTCDSSSTGLPLRIIEHRLDAQHLPKADGFRPRLASSFEA